MPANSTILIVDDDVSLRTMLEVILKEEGYDLLMAKDGVDAQQVMERDGKRISAIILDWTMPRMSGIEFLRWAKEQATFEYIPVILHTVLTSSEQMKEGIDAGAYYYLPKPATREVIHSLVRAAVQDYSEKQQLLKKIKESENPFRFLTEGSFRFRTLGEGEFLAVRIANACPVPERAALVMEMITNAIEHGNLGITYREKGRLMEEGTWLAEIQRRLEFEENKAKFVDVNLKRYDDRMTVLIEDEGRGFDFAKYLDLDENRLLDNHGRGIAMARAFLDLQYFNSGNKVLVTIPFHES
ncbi:MAG: response regulator [Ignavibacteriales bacterium]|nr:response regulator [Ignavibacteriales bacterium]